MAVCHSGRCVHDGRLKIKKPVPQIGECIKSCDGVQDGDYKSCIGCNVYASCSGDVLYDNRPCPGTLQWDDNLKRCDYSSTTC
ncbi:hypothetical protein MAR_001663 [Mya arenaria]|uniref:Chitin-binding type-2 domain-containing protein n=1 Tax=Mya arenaria TaxID=6604 RepID=A0ABY7FCF9_MYAAR|nr:hypothetical protein MAR_001663 [Mya arenaria]